MTATLDAQGVVWPPQLPPAGTWRRRRRRRSSCASIRCVRPGPPVAPAVAETTCANGTVTTPTVTLDDITVDRLHRRPAGPLRRHEDDHRHRDRRRPRRLHVGVNAAGVDSSGRSPGASYSLTLDGSVVHRGHPCRAQVTQAVCRDGVVTARWLSTPTTDGITYTSARPGPLVGARIDGDGHRHVGRDRGRVAHDAPCRLDETSPTTATFTVTFNQMSCTVVVPVAPRHPCDVRRRAGPAADGHPAGRRGSCSRSRRRTSATGPRT